MRLITVIQIEVVDRDEGDATAARLRSLLEHIPNSAVTHQISDSIEGFQTNDAGEPVE